jgi:hypothetical protein
MVEAGSACRESTPLLSMKSWFVVTLRCVGAMWVSFLLADHGDEGRMRSAVLVYYISVVSSDALSSESCGGKFLFAIFGRKGAL